MARGHPRLIRIEVRSMRREAMWALDIDHRERMSERLGVPRAAQQLVETCRGIFVGWAELLGVVRI